MMMIICHFLFIIAMQDALALLSSQPNKATIILQQISHREPQFLQMLKNYILSLHQRLNPTTATQQLQCQQSIRTAAIVFNRFFLNKFQTSHSIEKVVLVIQKFYSMLIELLLNEQIGLMGKKMLVKSLTKAIENYYRKERMKQFLDSLMNKCVQNAYFVYLEAILQSNLSANQKLESINNSYDHLYYIAESQLKLCIGYYLNRYMDTNEKGDLFFEQLLKDSLYILEILHQFIVFIHTSVLNEMGREINYIATKTLLDDQLASYLNLIMSLQVQLISGWGPNKYGLKVMIVNNLKLKEKQLINKMKSKALKIIKLILSITDKQFNLDYTDKQIMKNLPSLTNFIVNDLLICSDQHIYYNICEEAGGQIIIASMMEVLSQLVLFKGLNKIFTKFGVEQLARLTFCYGKTSPGEFQTFQNCSQEFIFLNSFIILGEFKDEEDINKISGQCCVKMHVCVWIKNMMNTIEGFTSIMLDLVTDVISLIFANRPLKKFQTYEMLDQKYNFISGFSQTFELQETLMIGTALLHYFGEESEKRNRLKTFLQVIKMQQLNDIELTRVYIMLTFNSMFFEDNETQRNYYFYIEQIFKTEQSKKTLILVGHEFISQLMVNCKVLSQKYFIFIDRILNELVNDISYHLGQVESFSTLEMAIIEPNIVERIINLEWINRYLHSLVTRFKLEVRESKRIQVIWKVEEQTVNLIQKSRQLIDVQTQKDSLFEGNLNAHKKMLMEFLNEYIFEFLIEKMKSDDLQIDEIKCIFHFCSIIFELMIGNFPFEEVHLHNISLLMRKLLVNYNCLDEEVDDIVFKLVYKFIDLQLPSMNEEEINDVIKWMIQNHYKSEVNLNRVCLVLQLFFYSMLKNGFKIDQAPKFRAITQALEKKLQTLLIKYQQFTNLVSENQNQKKIHSLSIKFNMQINQKIRPITIIRLYNTFLLNPIMQLLQPVIQNIKNYTFQNIGVSDLAVQVVAFGFLIDRSKNFIVLEALRVGVQMLKHNLKPQTILFNQQNTESMKIKKMMNGLHSPFCQTDPCKELYNLVERWSQNQQFEFAQKQMTDREKQINLIEYLRQDQYLSEDLKNLITVRRVNDMPRKILKIKRTEDDEC